MKRHLLLSLFLALALCFSGCILPAFPLGSLTTTTGDGGGQPTAPPYDNDTASYGFYYDQLSENEKAVYRAIYKGAREATNITFTLKEQIRVYTLESKGADAHSSDIRSAVKGLVQPAMDALAYDHPEIGWISYGGEGGSSFSISVTTLSTDTHLMTPIDALTFVMHLEPPMETMADIAAFEAEMGAVVREILAGAATAESRYEQLALLQMELSTRVTYDKTAERAHEAAGALLDGLAVCDGYAKAFKILCDAAGIPCVVIAGTAIQNETTEPHAWNYVQMEDGLWYAVDTTWNDDGESASSAYFLLGASTVPYFGRAPFAHTHLPDGKFSAGEYEPFTFPPLSDVRYLPF